MRPPLDVAPWRAEAAATYGVLMRASGALIAPPVDAGEYACWRFDDDADHRDAAVEHLGDGVAQREGVVYVADRRTDVMRSEVSPLGGDLLGLDTVMPRKVAS